MSGSKNVEKFGKEMGRSAGVRRWWQEDVWQKALEHMIKGYSFDPLRSIMMLRHSCFSSGGNDTIIAMWTPHFAKGGFPAAEREAPLGEQVTLVAIDPKTNLAWNDLSEGVHTHRRLARIFSGSQSLSTPLVPSDEDVRQAEEHSSRAENRRRLLTDLARLRAECLTSAQVREGLGVSRERLRQLREKGRLIAIPVGDRKSMLYPYWQFAEDGLIDGVEVISDAAEELDLSPRQLHFFMTEKNDRLDGRDPARVLLRGDNQGEARKAAERIAQVLRTSGFGEP